MTYREQLNQLLANCVRKAQAYMDAARVSGQAKPDIIYIREEWEQAEAAHTACLDLIWTRKVGLDDPIRDY